MNYYAIVGNYAAIVSVRQGGDLLLVKFHPGARKKSPVISLHWCPETGADLDWTAPSTNSSTTWLDELEAEVLGGLCVRDHNRQAAQKLSQEQIDEVRKQAHRLQAEEVGWFADCLHQAALLAQDEALLLSVRDRVQSGATYVELPKIPVSPQAVDRAHIVLQSFAPQIQG